ncbi:MAG: hypothetical protein K6G53_08420 [Bacteroidales bacterium]|jgi:hypothetical protein|nr:hypothetical protein [Bacteroidales bacterium]
MKKLFVVIALAILSISANAQLYLGGALSFQAAGNNATVTILPELGYNINKTSAIGAQIGWSNATAANRFVIAPYYRYGVKAFGPVSFFIDGEFQLNAWTAGGATTTQFGVGIAPGIAIMAGNKFSFVGHLARIGYYNGAFGINIDTNQNFQMGVYYHF